MTTNYAEAPDARSRFLTLQGVADVLNVSKPQAYALVRSGDLPAIKVGGRGQWRVEASALEDMIQRAYQDTKTFVAEHPFGGQGAIAPEDLD